MIEFAIFDRKIYLNKDNGDVSFDKTLMTNKFQFFPTEISKHYKVKCYTFCFSVANACNFSCKYCFNKHKDGSILNFEDVKNSLDSLFNLFNDGEKYFIDLSGYGEPLLNLRCVLNIAKYCIDKSNELNVEIIPMLSTNGYLLTEQIAKILQDNKVLFGISLDGNEIIHNENRVTKNNEKTYKVIIDNVFKIKNKDYIGVSITLTNHVFPLYNTLKELNKTFKTISCKFVRDEKLGIDDISKWIDEYIFLTTKLEKEIKENNFNLLFALINGDDFYGKFLYRAFGNFRTLNRCDQFISRFCYVKNNFYIGCPVQFDTKKYLTNINYLKTKQREVIEKSFIECKECGYKLYCGGECCIEKDINGGSINNKHCKIKIKVIQLVLYLKLVILEYDKNIYKKMI